MGKLMGVLKELFGLFVDDGSLAVALIGWLVVVGLAAPSLPLSPSAEALILFLGVLAILVENVARTARSRRPG